MKKMLRITDFVYARFLLFCQILKKLLDTGNFFYFFYQQKKTCCFACFVFHTFFFSQFFFCSCIFLIKKSEGMCMCFCQKKCGYFFAELCTILYSLTGGKMVYLSHLFICIELMDIFNVFLRSIANYGP